MNNRGYTMIELLATMVLLSILMIISVPTVLKTMDNSRKTTVLSDAKKFISNVEYKLKNNNNYIKKPRGGSNCIAVTLGYLDLGTDFQEGPHGGEYDPDLSYVVVKLKNGNSGNVVQQYQYYVTLVEKYGTNGHYGCFLVPFEELEKHSARIYVDGMPSSKIKKPTSLSSSDKIASGGTLGCSTFTNTAGGASDKVYDIDDSLREQGMVD